MNNKRCFISIELPGEARRKARGIQNSLPAFIGKKTEFENIHLTLKFLGEIDEEKIEKVKEELGKISLKKFKIKINLIGVFSEKFVRIVWIGVDEEGEENRELWKLQEKIDEVLKDLFEKERRFMGHITIARVKNVRDKERFLSELKKIKINLEFEVEKFNLKFSVLKPEGPEYKDIEVFSLV